MDIKKGSLSDPEQEYFNNFVSDVSPRAAELKYALYNWLKSALILELGAMRSQWSEDLHRINEILEELNGQV